MNSPAPIILFVYNRPWHTQQTIGALAKNKLAKESNLYIFSDGPKNESVRSQVEEVRLYLKTIKGFNNITIFESKTNQGLSNSVISGVTTILNKHEKAIVLEDDIVTSENFLSFINEALSFYEEDKSIYCISGYLYPIEIPVSYKEEVFIFPRASSWGWATWKNRWEKADWEIKDYNNFIKDRKEQKAFEQGGDDLTRMLWNQMNGKVDSWAIRWTYTLFRNSAYCLFPTQSLVSNIGTDNSGTHVKSTNRYQVELTNEQKMFRLKGKLVPDKEISKKLRSFFSKNVISKLIFYIRSTYGI